MSETLRRPQSLRELFLVFNRLSLQGFGGVLPIAQRELVERERWLSKADFVDLLSTSQVLPGPNVVNLSLMFGDRHFGWRGALAALAGMLLVPLVIVIALAALYAQFVHLAPVAGALRGMGAVAAGLVISTGFKVLPALASNPLGRAAVAAHRAGDLPGDRGDAGAAAVADRRARRRIDGARGMAPGQSMST